MAEIGNTAVFSQTDASNNTATDPGWPEGMAPSRVNDAARALQGALTRDWNWRGPTVTGAGTANAQTLTYSVAPAAYYTGQVFTFKAGATNTAAMTVNVNALGAKNLFVNNAACVGGEIISGQWYTIGYDGTQFQLLSPVATQHGGLIGVQKWTAAGTATYTPSAGTNRVLVKVRGGGGGGGGVSNAAGVLAGAGGGQGGYSEKFIASGFSGVTVTVGAGGTAGSTSGGDGGTGGTSSFGSAASATGGTGGQGATSVATRHGGAGGVGSSGDLNFTGAPGIPAIGSSTASGAGGGEGGGVEKSTASASSATGANGGGGGGAANAASTGVAGGVGGDGWVIVYEYN